MSVLSAISPLYSVSGFAVGLLVGLTGVGGGSLMTPLLVLLFGIHPSTAVGTDLLYASITKTGGTLVHGLTGSVDWLVVRRLAIGSIPATAVTLLLLSQVGSPDSHSALISTVLGIALILTAISLVFRKQVLEVAARRIGALSPERTRIVTIATGVTLGVLVSISSVGAGALGMTVLIFLYPTLPVSRLVGSDIAHAVPLTLIAGLGHWAMGSVDGGLLVSLLTGSIPGIVIGSLIASRVPDVALRPILAGTLMLVGSKLAL